MASDRVSERLRDLSAERRKLLERLLSPLHSPVEPLTRNWTPGSDALRASLSPDDCDKARSRRFYDAINEQLSSTVFGEHATFLNYGYVADASPRYAQQEAPTHAPNRASITLILELVGDSRISGKRVLDVGCGRGGTILTLDRYFQAGFTTGLDLSSAAIAFCRRTHHCQNTWFLEGDAEQLPFANASYDVVTSVESSHSYPDISSFYREVGRVLRPSGSFLYTDVFPRAQFAEHLDLMQRLGFVIEHDRDITSNVLLSCNATASLRSIAFDGMGEPGVIEEFLSVPGSGVFEEMQSGRAVYKILRLTRSDWS